MHTVLDRLNRGLPFSGKMTLKGGKCMEIGWRQIWRVGWMRKYVPLKIIEENLCETRRVGTRILVQKTIPFLNFPLRLFCIARHSLKSISQCTSALTVQPGGRYSCSKTPFESQNNVNMTLPAESTSLNFLGAFPPFSIHDIDCCLD